MRLDAKARALNATFTALSCNKGALCMRAFWFDAKQPLSMQHSHLSFASETELCIDQPCIAKDASAMHDHFVESGQTQAHRLSTRHYLRVCIASGGPRGPPGKVPVGTGEIPVPAGTDPREHVCLPEAL